MTTRRSLKPTDPLLVGRLRLGFEGFPRRPHLSLDVWCPYCKREHHHGWGPENRPDGVEHRAAHCAGDPFGIAGYFIGLDPSARDHNRRVAVEYKAALLEARAAGEGRPELN